jgi:tetratricopeptide (TPR) repeat protein
VEQFIAINSFFSTSKKRKVALFFLGDINVVDDNQRILFVIKANPNLNGIKPFADINHFSANPDEEEVLIMPGTIFRIHNIHMTLCSNNEHELKSILDHMLNEDDDAQDTGLLSLGHVLTCMGKYDDATKYYRCLLNELPNDHEDIADCYYSLGNVALKKYDFDLAIKQHRKALKIKRRILESNHPFLATSYNSIGDIYHGRGDIKRALTWYRKALVIFQQNANNYPHIC